MIYYIMGVSGCGKSTIGTLLAKKLSLPYFDGDDFHSPENVAKMASGIPLTDEDRWPWLENIAIKASELADTGAVFACSALKAEYRKVLEAGLGRKITWVFLSGSRELLTQRLQQRKGHYMPPDLLQSQLDTLEPPKNALRIDISAHPEEIINQIITQQDNHQIS